MPKKVKDVLTNKEKLEIAHAMNKLKETIYESSKKAKERRKGDLEDFFVVFLSTVADALNQIRKDVSETLDKMVEERNLDRNEINKLKRKFLINPFITDPSSPTIRTWKSLEIEELKKKKKWTTDKQDSMKVRVL